MSGNNLTVDNELRYIIQWFNEWSDYQKTDFLPILTEYLSTSSGVYLNGIVSGLAGTNCNEKPMSLFQCRIKLFKEWSPKWSQEIRNKLIEKIAEIDTEFSERLQNELISLNLTNGSAEELNHKDFLDDAIDVIEQAPQLADEE